ncbi:TMEM175 family protein [Streptomyces sp. JJ36]|uniref:TMEM175 family protein n=1 Tax=Streptomyces sp. JJ36 TaxID=2736645 RepID=UPI001F284845|nr:TMEM175 family protein [Streptomyces sp. JJ36]MCF6521731.1 DUF1211 domain-containing protein [Streptomyces sp. JJ36]
MTHPSQSPGPAAGRPRTGAQPDHLVPKHRMLALTDGVVAIAMTLLVLDIEVPDGLRGQALNDALSDALPQVGAFLLSAVVIALFWRAHHAVMREAEDLGHGLFWLNITFLVLMALIPFPTSVLQDYGDRSLGPGLYGLVIGVAALVLYALEVWVGRSRGRGWRSVPLPAQGLVFLASIGVAVVSPSAALYSWIAAIPLSALADRHAGRHAQRPGHSPDGTGPGGS